MSDETADTVDECPPTVGRKIEFGDRRAVWVGRLPDGHPMREEAGAGWWIQFARPRGDGEERKVTDVFLSDEAADALLWLMVEVREDDKEMWLAS